jgi:hypothetical protein
MIRPTRAHRTPLLRFAMSLLVESVPAVAERAGLPPSSKVGGNGLHVRETVCT